jgi:4-hydroxybenzoate polyprenyltransferase
MTKIYGFLQTTRFLKSFFVAVAFTLLSISILYGIAAFFFLTFSFVFNDWVDVKKDTVGHPHRAIPSGKITRGEALIIATILLISGLVWVTIFQDHYLPGFLSIYIFSIIYSLILKPNLPIIATPVWSLAIAILFVQPFTDNLQAYIGVFSIVYGYEMLLDYRDRYADKQFIKTPTLANLLGGWTFFVTITTITFGAALLLLLLF